MMLEHYNTVNNFIHLVRTKPSLFSEEDREELKKLIDEQPDDIEIQSNIICEWLELHPKIDNALGELEKTEIGQRRGPGDVEEDGGIPDYQPNKSVINNALLVRKNSQKDNGNTGNN